MSGGMLSPAGIDDQAAVLATVPAFRDEVGALDGDGFESWLEATIDRWAAGAMGPPPPGVDPVDQLASCAAIARRAWEMCGHR